MEWDPELIKQAEEKINKNSSVLVSDERANDLQSNANEYWNKFYSIHENKFFKDRNWLFTEFPELLGEPSKKADGQETTGDSKFHILEVGCGVGNTIFPIIRSNK